MLTMAARREAAVEAYGSCIAACSQNLAVSCRGCFQAMHSRLYWPQQFTMGLMTAAVMASSPCMPHMLLPPISCTCMRPRRPIQQVKICIIVASHMMYEVRWDLLQTASAAPVLCVAWTLQFVSCQKRIWAILRPGWKSNAYCKARQYPLSGDARANSTATCRLC